MCRAARFLFGDEAEPLGMKGDDGKWPGSQSRNARWDTTSASQHGARGSKATSYGAIGFQRSADSAGAAYEREGEPELNRSQP